MPWFEFILIALATFRLTRLVVYDQITTFLREPFHDYKEEIEPDGTVAEVLYVKGEGFTKFIGELLSCHWCTGVWCAIILYGGIVFIPIVFHPIIYILAIAAVASLIEECFIK